MKIDQNKKPADTLASPSGPLELPPLATEINSLIGDIANKLPVIDVAVESVPFRSESPKYGSDSPYCEPPLMTKPNQKHAVFPHGIPGPDGKPAYEFDLMRLTSEPNGDFAVIKRYAGKSSVLSLRNGILSHETSEQVEGKDEPIVKRYEYTDEEERLTINTELNIAATELEEYLEKLPEMEVVKEKVDVGAGEVVRKTVEVFATNDDGKKNIISESQIPRVSDAEFAELKKEAEASGNTVPAPESLPVVKTEPEPKKRFLGIFKRKTKK